MKLSKGYAGINFATVESGFADFPGYAELVCQRRMRLTLLLSNSRMSFDAKRIVETPTASADAIKGILKSIKRIADFAADPDLSTRDSMQAVYSEADSQVGSGNGSAMVSGFFNSAAAMYQIAKNAEQFLREGPRPEREQLGAMAWLVGARLPEIYSIIFRKPFTTTASKPANENLGISFVQRSLAVLKVRDDMPMDTILVHVKSCRRTSSS